MAQPADSTDFFIKSDSVLKQIISYLPDNWNYMVHGNHFILENNDSIWVLDENRINAQVNNETKEERNNRIKTTGRKSISKIILRFEPRWSESKLLATKNTNAVYFKMISALDSKYDMRQYYDTLLSRKGNPVYNSNTDQGKELIKKYMTEKNEYNAKIITLPNYHSNNYSFFIQSLSGCNDDYHYVYPEKSSMELYKILFIFFELGNQ